MTTAILEDVITAADIKLLDADLRTAARTLSQSEARFLVDTYYAMQQYRIEAGGQQRALKESGEPVAVLNWMEKRFRQMEATVQRSLATWTDEQQTGRWAKSITGIGPVLAAGFLANIEIEKAPTVGHIWRFAGLDPSAVWGEGEKRPWNAGLKVLAWKAGESFVKVSNNDNDYYGHVYVSRKALEMERNERGDFADQAAAALKAKRYRKETEARKWYESGKLPPAHIHARSKRYAVKLFLSHLHHVMYESAYGTAPPKPYIFTEQAKVSGLGNHRHFEGPPNWPID